MAGATRDWVTVDLRGIGDVVRAAAVARQTMIAALVRQALVDAKGEIAAPTTASSIDHFATSRSTVKLALRLPGVAAQTQPRGEHKTGATAGATRSTTLLAWVEISKALAASGDPADRQLSSASASTCCGRMWDWLRAGTGPARAWRRSSIASWPFSQTVDPSRAGSPDRLNASAALCHQQQLVSLRP